MINTLKNLTGNARACIWTEPLWGIPYNLYIPYVSLYMYEMGLSPAQIGYIATISLVVQIISSVLSGVLTDKLGRRRCTVIFDTLAWSVPELLWALSQNFAWFAVAALFNGMWRVTVNSWGLLLIEDTEEEKVVRLFSLTQLMGLTAAFVAPLSKLAIDAFGLVPTMRVLYFITFVSMTAKFIVLNHLSHETEMGKKRMAATKDQSIWSLIWGCRKVFLKIIREKRMLYTIAISATYQIISTLNANFWSLMVTQKIGVADGNIVWFTTFKSLVLLLCILLIAPRIRFRSFRNPMLISWLAFGVSQALLLIAGQGGGGGAISLLFLSVALEGAAISMLSPLIESLLFINAEPEERARILGLVYGTIVLLVTAFPALAGLLAQINLSYPFYINLVMLAVGILLTLGIWRENKRLGAELSE